MTDKNSVLQFIKSQGLGVYSTASKSGKSQSAVMAIAVTDDFIIYFSTEATTRKIKNLLENPLSSLVIGGLSNDPYVQMDGNSVIVADLDVESVKSTMMAVCPELKEHLSPTLKFIKFVPTWLRFSDYLKNPRETWETNL